MDRPGGMTYTEFGAIGCSALYFFNRHVPPGYDDADLVQLAMLSIAVGTTAALTGLLRQRWLEAFSRERVHHATANRLSAALDHMNIGIVLLDANTCAEFINRAFRSYFSLPDEKADSRPPFVALMYHGRATRAYELPEDELNAYVARRMEMVRAGAQRAAGGRIERRHARKCNAPAGATMPAPP